MAKKTVTISIDEDLYYKAKADDLPLSWIFNQTLKEFYKEDDFDDKER